MKPDLTKIKYKQFKESKIDFDKAPDNPFHMFSLWFNQALETEGENATSFVLSTVDSQSVPSSRVVLLKDLNNLGFIFFTNYNSSKSKHIQRNSYVSANFFWQRLEKQVRIVGKAVKISEKQSNVYYNSRPRNSQLGAWASKQSEIIEFDYDLVNVMHQFDEKFSGKIIDKPSYWGGYQIIPEKIEFWQGRPNRLHDRLLFCKNEDSWAKKRLSP